MLTSALRSPPAAGRLAIGTLALVQRAALGQSGGAHADMLELGHMMNHEELGMMQAVEVYKY